MKGESEMLDDPVELRKVLEAYKIVPRYVEPYGKVLKIYTPFGNYALKKYERATRNPIEMIETDSSLFQRGFQNIAPIFRGNQGEYLIENAEGFYYLMPWYEENGTSNQKYRYEQMFKQLSILHHKTVDIQSVDPQEIENYAEGLRAQLEFVKENLADELTRCEYKTYMSPSELFFCTTYFKTKQAIEFSQTKLEEWEAWAKETKESRTVTNHGDLSLGHYVVDQTGRGYFINFEKSRTASPVNDLLQVSHELLQGLPLHNETKWNWMINYFDHFEWSKGERMLYMIHLSNPIDWLDLKMETSRIELSEMHKVGKMQQIYWKMLNTEYVVSKLLEIEAKQEEQIDAE